MPRVLVGIDGSPPSHRALEHAITQAKGSGHEIVLLTVIPEAVRNSSLGTLIPAGLELPPELSRSFEETARLRLDGLAEQIKGAGVKVRAELRSGSIVEEFLRTADELDAVEIVIGQKSYDPKRAGHGPNASAIAERAKVRVTFVA